MHLNFKTYAYFSTLDIKLLTAVTCLKPQLLPQHYSQASLVLNVSPLIQHPQL